MSTLLAAFGCAAGAGDVADGERLARWSLEPLARIGSVDDPELGLTRVSQVSFGPDRLVYIAQSAESEIRAYGLDGSLIRRIGRKGAGPGEFRSISAIGVLHDTLYDSDSALRRVSTFDREGEPVESFRWSSTAEAVRPPVFSPGSPPSLKGIARIYGERGFLPVYLPPVRSIRTGQDGTIWIEREAIEPDSTTWNAIAADGELAGAVRLAAEARIMAAIGDLLAVLELDELDVPYVLIHRIVRPD